jgi:hypothetical protein
LKNNKTLKKEKENESIKNFLKKIEKKKEKKKFGVAEPPHETRPKKKKLKIKNWDVWPLGWPNYFHGPQKWFRNPKTGRYQQWWFFFFSNIF